MATGIECFRVQFPKNMDANEYALKVTPATKSLGMLLSKAAWLGKGQRPTVAVSEPQNSEEKSEAAAKEKIAEPITAAAPVDPSELKKKSPRPSRPTRTKRASRNPSLQSRSKLIFL